MNQRRGMKFEWIEITSCVETHPDDDLQCERAAPHGGQHWYTEWVNGEPSHPIFWGDEL